MAPLQPSAVASPQHNSRSGSSRSLRHANPLLLLQGGGGSSSGGKRSSPSASPSSVGGHYRLPPERSVSFHGRTSSPTDQSQRQNVMPRPKTQPDLLATGGGGRRMMTHINSIGSSREQPQPQKRVPAKVLVNVNVQRSLGAVQVMASTDWSVDQLVAAATKQYIKEGRRPPLPTSDPSAFGLHYSQFSLECLDPKEKLMGLGSRNFFLCPKQKPSAAAAAAAALHYSAPASSSDDNNNLPPPSSPSSSCSGEARDASKISIPWLRFMDFLL